MDCDDTQVRDQTWEGACGKNDDTDWDTQVQDQTWESTYGIYNGTGWSETMDLASLSW